MKLKKKIIAGIIGLLAFTGIAGATLLSGSTSGGLVFDGPLTSEWLQSSTVASDRSADHNHATISGGVTFGTDGATFNGTTGYLRGAVSDFRGGDSEGTIEAWISSDTSGASDYFSTADEATTGTFIIAQKTASGKILFSQKDNGGTADTIEGNTAMDLNTFYHVTITSNGTAWKLYLNG
ncbi:hypothetical protein KA005_26300, partial [bacterium]|nr:hypothetical protein [bacterium]